MYFKEGLNQASETWFARANLAIKSSGSFSLEEGISGAVLGLDCTSFKKILMTYNSKHTKMKTSAKIITAVAADSKLTLAWQTAAPQLIPVLYP